MHGWNAHRLLSGVVILALALSPLGLAAADEGSGNPASEGVAAPRPTAPPASGAAQQPADPESTPAPKAAEEGDAILESVEPPPAEKEVKVEGDVPEALFGRWLLLATLKLPESSSTIASLLAVERGADGTVTFDHRTQNLPGHLQESVAAANSAGGAFTPGADLLATLASKWGDAAPDVAGGRVRGLEYRFVASDHYDDTFKSDERTRDTKATLIISRFPVPPPGGRAPVRNDLFFFLKDVAPERLAGPHTNFQLIATFSPAPVTLYGDFTAYRIGAPPSENGQPAVGEKPSPEGEKASAADEGSSTAGEKASAAGEKPPTADGERKLDAEKKKESAG